MKPRPNKRPCRWPPQLPEHLPRPGMQLQIRRGFPARRPAFLILLLLLAARLPASDLNGIWRGTLTQGPGGCSPQYFLELQVHTDGDQLTGYAWDYTDKQHFVRMRFTGRYNPQTHRLVLIESKLLQQNIPSGCAPCMKTYDLTWSPGGAEETLSGDWRGTLTGGHTPCPPGKVILKRSAISDFPVDIEQTDTLEILQRTLHLQPRPKDLVKTITVDSPSIRVEFYDNAQIDNDTITVLVNNKLLLYRQMLTDKPLVINFHAFPGLEYELVMYADNLGLIPPNTALMVVKAGAQKMEVFMSSGEDKSASVRFVYRPQ